MLRRAISLLLLTVLSSCGIQKKVPGNYLHKNFDLREINLIQAGSSKEPMRVYKINNHSDSLLLRTNCAMVIPNSSDRDLDLFIDRLYATVTDSSSLGVGIAAPQVGILKRIIWVQRFDKKNLPFEVYINPEILQYSKKKQDCREGCLSIPGRSDTTKTRSYAILIKYRTQEGESKYEMVEGFTAVIFQHEIDHLNGILYLDHLAEESRQARKP